MEIKEIIKPGYKKTKFGWIPNDWNLMSIDEITDRITNRVEVEEEELYQEIGIRSHGKGIFHKEKVTGRSLGNKRVFWIEPDCFVVNIVFAWEQAVSKTTENEVGMIASHRFPMYKPKEGILDLDYLLYFFKTPLGKHLLGLASPGGAGRNKTLGQKEFGKLRIPIPPFESQSTISEIITTWENGIECTKKLIEEKKVFKNEVLKNIIRKRNHSNELWVKKSFKEVFKIYSSKKFQIPKTDYSQEGKIPIVDQGKKKIVAYTNTDNFIKDIPLIIFGDHTKIIKWIDFPFVPGADGTQVLKTQDSCFPLFGKYLLEVIELPDLGYSRHFKWVKEKSFYLPSLEHQKRIAKSLFSIDTEISLLKDKLKMLIKQKKGLSQKLFKGQNNIIEA